RLPHGTALATIMPEVLATYLGTRDRELALVAVALRLADPRDPAVDAARAAIEGIEALLRRVGQRRTLAAQGLGPDSHDTIAQDALADAAIANSPRLPSKPEILEILAAVAGGA
ncbi:MAG TPA: iron-containing alcohol dehydrogenase, partial [Candidatus Deferrimicrobium sp.]|nr:iron-containing alcohol dehydrogenase [Candidatus Deferrimicrobium sp.]